MIKFYQMDVSTLPNEAQKYIRKLEDRNRASEEKNADWKLRYNALEEQYKLLLLQK